jgi:hypothetical protein
LIFVGPIIVPIFVLIFVGFGESTASGKDRDEDQGEDQIDKDRDEDQIDKDRDEDQIGSTSRVADAAHFRS